MKNKLLVAIALTGTIVLFGCTTEQVSIQPAPLTSTQSNTPTNIQNPIVGQQTSNSQQVSNQYTAADQAAYQGAMELNDTTLCDKISDAKYKDQCKSDIANNLIITKAKTELNVEECSKISNKDIQEACKIQVQVLLQKQKNIDEMNKQNETDQSLRDEIVKSGDYTRCKELKVEGNVYDCEENILIRKAIETKDSSWCDKASLDAVKKICMDAIKK